MYEARDHLLICSEHVEPEPHQHSAAHIMISLNDTMDVEVDDELVKCKGILIPSGLHHTAKTYGNRMLVFLFDNTTSVSMQISNVRTIPDESVFEIREAFKSFECSKRDVSRYEEFVSYVLECNGIANNKPVIMDERIQKALTYIQSRLNEKITCADVAESVYLSEGRFSHLFKEQVGITFASYVIYQRVIKTYTDYINGISVTDAALEAGFSSSAHFAEVNKRLFGLSATGVKKDLQFHKVAEI